METEEKTKEYTNSVAENFGSLSLGIFAVSLIGGVQWATIVLTILGAIFALCAIYIRVPHDLKQKWFLRKVAKPENMAIFRQVGWLIVIVMFGYALTQTDIVQLRLIGLLFAISAYVIFYINIYISTYRLRDKKSRKLTDA